VGFLASVLLTLLLAPGVPSATVTPTSGPVGSRITVTGTGFDPGPVDIRWGDASGPVLGVTEGPDFTVDVTVPDGPAGTRSVVAVPREGGQAGAPAAFLVEPGGSSPTARGGGGRTDGVAGGMGGGAGGGVPAPGRRTSPTASGDRAAAPTPRPSSPGPAPAPMDQAGVETPGRTDPAAGPEGGFGATPDDDPVALGRARPAAEEAGGGSTPVMLAAAGVLLLGLAGAWRRRRRRPPTPGTLWE